MKNFLVLLIVALLSLSLNSVFAQSEDMNEAMMQAMTPGPMHELLARGVGEWKAEVKMWIPGQEPLVSEATSVRESILGGRYFKATHLGNMMGMPFEGFEISGYDNVKKKFFNMWMDNVGTGVLSTEGTYDEGSKTLTLTGIMTDPMGNDSKVRETIKMIDNDNTMFEMYVEENGNPEVKVMEINYTRVK